jgi:hypothetical protein
MEVKNKMETTQYTCTPAEIQSALTKMLSNLLPSASLREISESKGHLEVKSSDCVLLEPNKELPNIPYTVEETAKIIAKDMADYYAKDGSYYFARVYVGRNGFYLSTVVDEEGNNVIVLANDGGDDGGGCGEYCVYFHHSLLRDPNGKRALKIKQLESVSTAVKGDPLEVIAPYSKIRTYKLDRYFITKLSISQVSEALGQLGCCEPPPQYESAFDALIDSLSESTNHTGTNHTGTNH